ncbi:MAG: hypothetical protein J5648_08540 [Lachnospiraceae bacterium]|nr:hypothetical protein [Lachnospiraceae bacterium]
MQETKRRRGHPKAEGPTKDKTICLRVLESTYRQIKQYSAERGTSVAIIVNEAIEEYLQSKIK